MIKSYKDLDVYNLSYELATSQIVRSSRSISSHIVEGWAKRVYENKFKVHLADTLGSAAETQNWVLFATDCGHLQQDESAHFSNQLDQIGKMLSKLHKNWKTPASGI